MATVKDASDDPVVRYTWVIVVTAVAVLVIAGRSFNR